MRLKGFTLIELLIVVAIIAILAAIAVPNFLEAQVRAKVSRTKADMRSLATALESYTVDNNKPMTVQILGFSGAAKFNGPSLINSNITDNANSARFMRLTTPIAYITSVPPDVFSKDGLSVDINGNITTQYDTFDYWDAYYASPSGFLDTTVATYRGSGLTSGATWRMVSAGPDKINRVGGGYVGQFADNYRGQDYDPTNGTISNGDVVRVSSSPAASGRLPYYDRILNKYN